MSEPHAAAVLQRAAPPKTCRSEVYRHELKYRISYAEKAALELRLAPLLRRDAHAKPGGYRIRSLYFDDWWNSAYWEKEAGVFLRKKYRIRIYDGSDAVIKLERKKKVGSYIYKEDAALTREETERILRGDYGLLLASPQNLCREFYVECVSYVLRPRVLVDYEREAWVLDEGTVRITFDQNVRAAVGGWDLFDPKLPTLPVLDPGTLVLEGFRPYNVPQMAGALLAALAISSNVVISLGMVGALSIVRFRTAVKDPLDLLYLFWSITAGITTGAGMYLLAVAASAVMIGVVVFLSRWQTAGRSYVAVLHYQGEKPGDEIVRALGRNKFAVKSKTLRAEGTELAVEVCCRDNASEVTDRLRSIEGVEDVTMIQYNGEYHG